MTNKIKVLIAEEAADFRSGTPDFFEKKGYDAQFCEKNGNRVLENIDAFCPDVVLMDMFMSGIDGVGVMRTVKKRNGSQKPIFVIISGFDSTMLEKEALSAMLEMTDTSKIGLMGHSMGGATSVELGRERSDISAVADIDGTMLGEYQGVENGEFLINEEPYPVPVLEFVNWESYIDVQQYVEQGGRYPNEILIRQADTGFSTTVKDTLHMDFTDLPMFSPYLGKLLGSGERSTEETMKIVNSAVLSFFNCYLKGEGVFTVQDIY